MSDVPIPVDVETAPSSEEPPATGERHDGELSTAMQDAAVSTSPATAVHPSAPMTANDAAPSHVPEMQHESPSAPTLVPAGGTAVAAASSSTGPFGNDGLNVRLTHPQPQGTQAAASAGENRPQIVSVDRNTGQVRLDLGRGNVVTVPLQHHHPGQQQQARVRVNHMGTSPANNSMATGPNGAIAAGGHLAGGPTATANIRVSHLHPLRPEPVQETTSRASNTSNDDPSNDEALSRFKCALCCEFMKDPVGCPSDSCSARFCNACFVRAAQESQTSSSTYRANQMPRCPTCRVEYSNSVPDNKLKAEMEEQGTTLPCRHDGCPEKNLKLSSVQDHERNCSYQKVRCRYRQFGCPWVGPGGQVSEHEQNDCALARVKVLVEKFRRLEMDHSNRLSILQQQNHGALHMLQVYRHNAQRDSLKSTSNLFDLFHYCHVVTCSTNHFLKTKDRWIPLYRSNEGRAAVTNFLILLPTVLTCGNLSLHGVQSLLKFCFQGPSGYSSTSSSPSMTARALEFLLEDSLVGIVLGMLTTLMLTANFVDTKSSVTWGRFPMPGMGSPPVMCDILAVCIFTMHLGVLEFYGAGGKSIVVWLVLAVVSTFYPAVVFSLSHNAARGLTNSPAPTISNVLSKARSVEPILFGLRFCLVGTLFGILPTLDAAALNVLLQPVVRQYILLGESPSATIHREWWLSMLQMRNCFFDNLPRSFVLAYLGAKVALETVQYKHWREGFEWKDEMEWKDVVSHFFSQESLIWSTMDSALAFVVLLSCSVLLNCLLEAGFRVGKTLVQQAESANSSQNQPGGSNAPSHDYQLTGLVSFGAWSFLLGVLLCVR